MQMFKEVTKLYFTHYSRGNIKNAFVLKNIKNTLNKTESEHENIGKENKWKTKVKFPNLFRKYHNDHLNFYLGILTKIH